MQFLEYIETLGQAPYWFVMVLCAALWYMLEGIETGEIDD